MDGETTDCRIVRTGIRDVSFLESWQGSEGAGHRSAARSRADMAGRQDDESRESLFRRLLREQVVGALVDLDPALLRPGPAATDVGRGAPRAGQGVQCGRLGHRRSEWPLCKTKKQPARRTRRPAAQQQRASRARARLGLSVYHQRHPRRVREQKEQLRPAVGLEHRARQTHGRRTRPGSVAAALLGQQTRRRRRRRRCSGQVNTERAHGVMHAFPVRDIDIDPHRGLLQRRLCRCRAVSGKRPRECWAARARLRAQRPRSSREPRPPLALAPRAPARPETARCRALGPAASLPRRRHGSAALLSRIRPGRYTPTGRAALPPLQRSSS